MSALRRAVLRWLADADRDYTLTRCGIKGDRRNERCSIWWYGPRDQRVRLDCIEPGSRLWRAFEAEYGIDPQQASENPTWQPPHDCGK